MHRSLVGVALALGLALTLAGCAGSSETAGPPFAQAAATLPPVPPGESRIFFYRWVQPYELQAPTTVSLNGKPTGISWVGTTFYRDVPPGTYHITVFSPGAYPNQFKTVTVAAGSTLYVRIQPMIDWSRLQCNDHCEIDTFAVMLDDQQSARQQMLPLTLIRG
mgnify:FL=1